MAKISEAKKRSDKKYISKFEQVTFRLPKGKKAALKQFAEDKGFESLQAYFLRMLKEDGFVDDA